MYMYNCVETLYEQLATENVKTAAENKKKIVQQQAYY